MKTADKAEKMDAQKKEALKAAKEIAVKFIETGRLSPSNFSDFFPEIYKVVLNAVSAEPGFGKARVIEPAAKDGAKK